MPIHDFTWNSVIGFRGKEKKIKEKQRRKKMPGIPEFWIFGLWFTVGAFFVLRLQMCFFSSLIKTANKEIAKPAFKHFLNFSLSLNILSSLSSFNKWGCHMEKCANYCFASAGVAAGWDCGQRSSNHLGKFFTEGWSMSSATYFFISVL